MIRLGVRQWEIYRQGECEDCRLQERLRDRFAARQWLQQFKGNAVAMNDLRNILSRSSSAGWRMDRASDDEVIDQAAQLLSFGAWHVHGLQRTHQFTQTQSPGGQQSAEGDGPEAQAIQRRPQQSVLLSDSRQSSAAPSAPEAAKKLTWIEIVLIDADENPVPGAKYELRLSDGQIKSDTLDAKGRARCDGIPPGICTVCFPEYDRREWKKLSGDDGV
jgi:hypothetical protein